MKIEKNTYIYSAIIIVVVGTAIFWMGWGDNAKDTSIVSPSPEQSLNPSKTPELSNNISKPTPTLIKEIVGSYQYWFDTLDPLNRVLRLEENCNSIVPSQVDYPNNTKVMLDNTLSAEPRVLKIGTKEYFLGANSWSLVTLSSLTLPARLTMFCGSMELGELGLQ